MHSTEGAMMILIRHRLLMGGLFLAALVGAVPPAKAQQVSGIVNAPFQADLTTTRINTDGKEQFDPSHTAKIARSSAGCLRMDTLEGLPHQPSPEEVERFNAAIIGSPEEESLRIHTSLNHGWLSWMNVGPVPGLRPGPWWECRGYSAPDVSYCSSFKIKRLSEGYAAKDL